MKTLSRCVFYYKIKIILVWLVNACAAISRETRTIWVVDIRSNIVQYVRGV
jgi:hypothetical protein